jgi:hypothetical protein
MAGKLGKLAPKKNLKTLSFARYFLAGDLPTPPPKVFREYKVPAVKWGMYGNDAIGDCTCAAIAHMLMLVTAHTGTMVVPPEQDVLDFYSAVSGYVPGDASTDNGAAITDVLERWQTVGLSGHKILGWASIDHLNPVALKTAIYLFGAVNIGIQVPAVAMEQFDAKQAWHIVADDGGNEGGHSIPVFGYGSLGFTANTWAANQQYTNDWGAQYIDEAYAVVTEDWINQATGKAPNQLDVAALTADLAALKA